MIPNTDPRVWTPGRKIVPILASAPAAAVSVAGLLFFTIGLFRPPLVVTILLTSAGVAVVLARIAWWCWRVGRRNLTVIDVDMSVGVGEHALESADWKDMRSVELIGGDPVWKIWTAFIHGGSELPHLIVTLKSTWDGPVVLPQLLAPLRRELRSLDEFVRTECEARAVSYSGPFN